MIGTATAAAAASNGFAKIAVTVTAAFTALLAAIQTESLQQVASHADPETVVILANNTLRIYCLLGSLLGAIVRLSVHTPKGHAGFTRSFCACLFSGILFSPAIVRYFKVPPDSDYIVFTSGLVAFLAFIGLEGAERLGRKWFKKQEEEQDK